MLPKDALHMKVVRLILVLEREAPHDKTAVAAPKIIFGVRDARGTQERSAARQHGEATNRTTCRNMSK